MIYEYYIVRGFKQHRHVIWFAARESVFDDRTSCCSEYRHIRVGKSLVVFGEENDIDTTSAGIDALDVLIILDVPSRAEDIKRDYFKRASIGLEEKWEGD